MADINPELQGVQITRDEFIVRKVVTVNIYSNCGAELKIRPESKISATPISGGS